VMDDLDSIPSRVSEGIFFFATAPIQPPIQWAPGTLTAGVKRPGHEAHHSPPSSAAIKNA
jgi:hypothetical protein